MKAFPASLLPSIIFLTGILLNQFVNAEVVTEKPTNKTALINNLKPEISDIYQFANQCYDIYLSDNHNFLAKKKQTYVFSHNAVDAASKFTLRPSALGIYLLYDQDQQYLIANNGKLSAIDKLESEMTLNIPEKDYLLTSAEWEMHSTGNPYLFQLKNIKTNTWLSDAGLSADKNLAANLSFRVTTGCATFPESETGTSGQITRTQFEDGSLFGFVDAHEHSTANHGFGGKIFHGASFHKLGIPHALADCEKHHGKDGSKDIMSAAYRAGSGDMKAKDLLKKLYNHLINDEPDHQTDGYPTLSNWSVHEASTHQSLYYKWIERAHLGGMRIMVEYLESTEVVCEVYKELLPSESESESCNEMEHVDHQLTKIKELEHYIDAQNGGPGKGWMKIVYSPEEAREAVKAGKLAVILGIEIENPFNCFVNERAGFEPCDKTLVQERLNTYYNKGIRALFPSHKFVNSFSSGDGDAGILEIGDYRNTGQWRDYVDCNNVPGDYLGGHGEGKERSMFNKLASVPGMQTLNNLLSGDNVGTAKQSLPIYPKVETHCQRNGFTPLGKILIQEMMSLGMIIDLGHTPKAALNDIVPVLVENNYPAVNTHGGDQAANKILKGLSTQGLGDVCRDENGNSDLLNHFKKITEQINPETGLPSNGLSYDFNGFAGYAKPRFGELSKCEQKQTDPLVYPFKSFAGDVEFEQLKTGERIFDFNTLGLANIGLFPDLIEEARRSGASEESITSLFKTAEAYVQLWERAEARSTK